MSFLNLLLTIINLNYNRAYPPYLDNTSTEYGSVLPDIKFDTISYRNHLKQNAKNMLNINQGRKRTPSEVIASPNVSFQITFSENFNSTRSIGRTSDTETSKRPIIRKQNLFSNNEV